MRFSRLFGPGKPSSLPNIWRNVRKKRKKRKHKENNLQHDSDSPSDEDKPKRKGWTFNYSEVPSKELCKSDDEVNNTRILIISNLTFVYVLG